MEINIFENYADNTHVFGICYKLTDNLDRFGKCADEIHRSGMTKLEAIRWIKDYAEDGGNVEEFVIVASPKHVWETVEAGRK